MESENEAALSFAIIGNSLNLGYNIPFVYLIWKNRSTKDISLNFLILRFWGSVSWLVYAILVHDIWVGISYTVTLIASCMILYIKMIEYKKRKKSQEMLPKSEEENIDAIKSITHV